MPVTRYVDSWPQIEQLKVHLERNLDEAVFSGSRKFLQQSVPLGIEEIYIRHPTLENYEISLDYRNTSLFPTPPCQVLQVQLPSRVNVNAPSNALQPQYTPPR